MTPAGHARTRPQDVPPGGDEGNPPNPLALLRQMFLPTPGRLDNTVRITVLCLIAISISEVFRTPLTVLIAVLVFFMSTRDTGSSILTALLAGISLTIGVFLTILVFSFSLSQPALRIPLVALSTFLAMFLSRASSIGPAFFVCGFITAYALTFGDEVLGAALQPDSVTDTTEYGLPFLAYMPPVEALVHSVLWISLAAAIPTLVVIIGNILIGRDPVLLLRSALADRLAAAARYCEGEASGRRQLETFAREGMEPLFRLHDSAAKLHGSSASRGPSEPLIVDVSRLLSILLAWDRVYSDGRSSGDLASAGRACREAERAARHGYVLEDFSNDERDAHRVETHADTDRDDEPIIAKNLKRPLLDELRRVLVMMRDDLANHPRQLDVPEAVRSPPQLLVKDAFSNPDHARFALKVTLAMMFCYLVKEFMNWPQIQTCIVTCFLVSLDSVGESAHKAFLRLSGACIGGLLGITAILFVMPSLNDLGGLLCLLAPVLLLSAWIGSGSQRIAYCGLQIAVAFEIVVLQGYGPTLDMQTARDRIVGILLGDVAVLVVFRTIWPVSVTKVVRTHLANALDGLAEMMQLPQRRLAGATEAEENVLRRHFEQSVAKARSIVVNDPYEADEVRRDRVRPLLDSQVLTKVQELILPVSVILGDEPAKAVREHLSARDREVIVTYQRAMSDWFRSCARWVRDGTGAADLAGSLPQPPDLGQFAHPNHDVERPNAMMERLAGRIAWHKVLHDDLRSILDEVAPTPAHAARSTHAEVTVLTRA